MPCDLPLSRSRALKPQALFNRWKWAISHPLWFWTFQDHPEELLSLSREDRPEPKTAFFPTKRRCCCAAVSHSKGYTTTNEGQNGTGTTAAEKWIVCDWNTNLTNPKMNHIFQDQLPLPTSFRPPEWKKKKTLLSLNVNAVVSLCYYLKEWT